MSFAHKKTPEGQTGGIPQDHSYEGDTAIIADSAQFFAQMLEGIYVAVAEIRSPGADKRFRRYYFANLPSAQRRVDKAREDGREAYLYLGQIHIVGGDLDG